MSVSAVISLLNLTKLDTDNPCVIQLCVNKAYSTHFGSIFEHLGKARSRNVHRHACQTSMATGSAAELKMPISRTRLARVDRDVCEAAILELFIPCVGFQKLCSLNSPTSQHSGEGL